jgi:hypothetical protein
MVKTHHREESEGTPNLRNKKMFKGSDTQTELSIFYLQDGRIKITRVKATNKWEALHVDGRKYATTYMLQDRFAEPGTNARSLHDDIAHALQCYYQWNNIPTTTPGKEILGLEKWNLLFQSALTKEQVPIFKQKINNHDKNRLKIQHLAACLALSDPEILFKAELKNDSLNVNNQTAAWRAAVAVLGSLYPDRSSQGKTIAITPDPKEKLGDNIKDKEEADISENPTEELPKSPPSLRNKKNKATISDHRRFEARFDLQLRLRPNENFTKTLIAATKKWYSEMKDTIDSKIILKKWWINSLAAEPLEKIVDWPDNLKDLNTYFNGSMAQVVTGAIIYLKVYVALDQAPERLTSNAGTELSPWYFQERWGCYKRTLTKSDYAENIGYLMYSSNFTDASTIMELNTEALKKLGYHKEVGGKIRPTAGVKLNKKFRDDYREKGGKWFNQYWQKLQIDTDKRNVREARKAMIKIWNSPEPQPGNSNYRFVPSDSALIISKTGQDKKLKAHSKHDFVVKTLCEIEAFDVLFLDKMEETSGITLRTFLMSLKHSETNEQLFHSVDKSQSLKADKDTMLTCTAYPEHETEAIALSAILPALTAHKLNNKCLEWFTPMGRLNSTSITFNEDGTSYTCTDDTVYDFVLEEKVNGKAEFYLEGIPKNMEAEKEAQQGRATGNMSVVSFGSDAQRADGSGSETEDSNSRKEKIRKSTDTAILKAKNSSLEIQLQDQFDATKELREQINLLKKLNLQQQENDTVVLNQEDEDTL